MTTGAGEDRSGRSSRTRSRASRRRVLVGVLLLLIGALGAGCSAKPTTHDVDRVKQRFLELRFSAPFQPRFRSLSDRELFRMSCEQMRVNCTEVLDRLKQTDPQFHAKLSASK